MPACHAGGHEFESRTHRKKSSSVNSGGLFLKPKIDTNIKRNMCGIVGYIGRKDAFPILIKGLRRLEYRGYDSAGVALINNDNSLNVYKSKGKVDNLVEYCNDKDVSGTVGIAHTRWATHGEPSSRNAHPHYSESKNLAIIHNGIIENYADLKEKLKAKGVHFVSAKNISNSIC